MPYKVSRLPGAPGGGSYALKTKDGLCPIPMEGVVLDEVPAFAKEDPWLKVEEGPGFSGVPTAKDHLAKLAKDKAAREKRVAEAVEKQNRALADAKSKGPRGPQPLETQVAKAEELMVTRAKAKAKQAGESEEKWQQFVPKKAKEALADLKKRRDEVAKAQAKDDKKSAPKPEPKADDKPAPKPEPPKPSNKPKGKQG